MAQAVLCPVCEGNGEKVIPAPVGGSSVLPHILPCNGCGGKGWIVIPTSGEEIGEYSKGWVEVSAPALRPDEYIALQRKVTLICPDCGGDRYNVPGIACLPGRHWGTVYVG